MRIIYMHCPNGTALYVFQHINKILNTYYGFLNNTVK